MKITINKQEYKIPETFSISEYQKITQYDISNIRQWNKIIHLVTGIPMDVCRNVHFDSKELAIAIIGQRLYDRIETELPDFAKIDFGQFIDLEYYISVGYSKHLQDIIDTLTGKANNCHEGIFIADEYIKWRNQLMKQYAGLFETESETETDETVKSSTQVNPQHIARSWYKITIGLASNDLLKIDEVTDQPLMKVLNFLSYQKQEYQEAEMKRRQEELKRNHKKIR